MASMRLHRNEGVYEFLRASIDITQVLEGNVGEKVDCVFHEEDDVPDLHIYEDHAYCFVCNESGDVTKVWKGKHGFSTMWEAAQDLARKFGVELPKMDPAAQARYEERRRKEDEHAKVAAERHKALKDPNNPIGAKVQEYITGRGITDEIRDRFMLGATEIGDLNIPFWVGTQIHGQVIRRLEGRLPKYKAPKAEDFPLGRRPILMVGSPKAQPYLLVEGYLDQPAAEVLGIRAIGTGAAKLSKEQVADLRELGEKGATFYVLPDDDGAGDEAARRNTADLYPYAYMTPPIPGEGIKDVSDLYKEDPEHAAAILEGLMDEGRDAIELALAELPKRPVDKVRHLKRSIVPLILQLEHRSERDAVIKDVAKADGLNSKIVADAVLEQEAVTLVRDDPATDEEDIPRSEWEHLLEPGVLERYRDTVCRRQGVVGEVDKQVVEAVTLCMSGAQLGVLPSGKPAGSSMALLGPAGRGKNYLCDATVSIAPPEWYRAFTIASAQAFYWAAKVNPAFLKHVFIYPNEIEAVDAVTEFLRPMLSQGHAEKFVVNKDNNGAFQFEAINVEGPITGVLPTVRNKLEDQLQTRLLITELTDYEGRVQQQTQALSRQRSRTRMAEVSDEERKLWEAALRSLTATRRVIWDFADKPEFSLNNDSLEHGARLWGNLLGLAEANAFLEQNNWEVTTLEDGSEAIVADARDYEVAYRLLEATSKRSMENISDVHRKILDAVHKLQAGHTLGGWSMNKIAREAHVSSATVHRHKTFLTKSLGYLAEDEDGGLRLALGVDPSWWEKGEAMRGFPTPKEIQSWEGDTPPPESEILRNSETESQNPDTYAEKPVSQERNGSETSETAGSVVYAGKGGPGYDIYIGDRETRGGHDLPQSPWYNPFKIDKPGKKRDGTRKEVCIKYINYLNGPVENYRGRVFDGSHLLDRLMETDGQELDGKVLGCWCAGKDGAPEVLTATEPLPVHCHGQILLQAVRNIKRIAEAESPNGKVEPPAGVNVDSVGVEYETLDDEVEVF